MYNINYIDFNVNGPMTPQLPTVSLTPIVAENSLRFVLSWYYSPKDLDIHTLFPVNSLQKCEVYFARKECVGVGLDVDNLQGGNNGVETITVNTLGTYIYSIVVNKYVDNTDGTAPGENNVNDQTSATVSSVSQWANIPLYLAKAKVSVYAPGYSDPILVVNSPSILDESTVMSGEYNNPTDPYDWWFVLCFDGSVGIDSILTINKYKLQKPNFTDCAQLISDNNNKKSSAANVSKISFGLR